MKIPQKKRIRHVLLHVFDTELSTSELDARFRDAWFSITGNIQYEDEVEVEDELGQKRMLTKSWFSPVGSTRQAAAYVSKYLSKGWFSRRQTSSNLNLSDAARDARLIDCGFLAGEVAANFVRHEDGFLHYESPFTDDEVDNVGATDWVGLSLNPLAPENYPHFVSVEPVAVFQSSSPVPHPASALTGACFDLDGNRLETAPKAWWFPFSALQGNLHGTRQLDALRSALSRARLGALRAVVRQRAASGLSDEAAASSLFHGRFPYFRQRDMMEASLVALPERVREAFTAVTAASDAEFAFAHRAIHREDDASVHDTLVNSFVDSDGIFRYRSRSP